MKIKLHIPFLKISGLDKCIFLFSFLLRLCSVQVFFASTLLSTGLLFSCFPSFAQSFTAQWTQTINPTVQNDAAYGIVADASGVYIAGTAVQNFASERWWIEKRDLSTGAIIWTLNNCCSNTPKNAYSITADASGIYVAGNEANAGSLRCLIEKRNLSTGALDGTFGGGTGMVAINPGGGGDAYYAITADATGIYLAGFSSNAFGDDSWWYIEKRDLSTGTLTWSKTSNPVNPSLNDYAYAIAADASGIYIAGIDDSPGNIEWRIEKRSLTTGALVAGFGTGGVVKSNPSANNEEARAIAVDANSIYVAGGDISSGNGQWRIEKRDKTTGALDATFGTGGIVTSNPSGWSDIARSISIDADAIYVAGIRSISGGRLEKRDKSTGALLCSVDDANIPYANTIDASGIYLAGIVYVFGDNNWWMKKYDLCGGALPVELLSFTSQWLTNEQEKALLTWQTATEINNNYFTLERSVDGVNFSSIATVNGAGNSSSILNYQYIDNTLPQKAKADIFYYRLKQTDFDGQYSYSNIEVLTRGSITIIGPSPNPIGEELKFTLVSAMEGEINITILSMLGQLVKKETLEVHKGIQQIKISLTTLSAGSYLLHIRTTDGAERISKKFVMK